MKYLSAGHCNVKGPNYDPGAPGLNGRWEANETVKIRDGVAEKLRANGYTDFEMDINAENRHQVFARIKSKSGDTVTEFHFNAGPPSATGTEVLVGVDADRLDKAMAADFAAVTALKLNIKNRGVKSEADTRHKRLGLMRETGVVCLIEVCFISNANDMEQYDKNFHSLCESYANIIIKYDNIIR